MSILQWIFWKYVMAFIFQKLSDLQRLWVLNLKVLNILLLYFISNSVFIWFSDRCRKGIFYFGKILNGMWFIIRLNISTLVSRCKLRLNIHAFSLWICSSGSFPKNGIVFYNLIVNIGRALTFYHVLTFFIPRKLIWII